MPDVYLCGNGSDTPQDITLRAATACGAVASTSGAAAALTYIPAPPRQLTSLIQVRVEIVGVGQVAAAGELALSATTQHTASVSGRTVTTLRLDHRMAGTVSGASTLDLAAHVSGDDPTQDELLLLLDLI